MQGFFLHVLFFAAAYVTVSRLGACFVAAQRLWGMGGPIICPEIPMTKNTQPTPRSSRRRRASRNKRSNPLLFNAIGALLAGAGFSVVSLVMSTDESTAYAAKALLAPAWMGLILGIGLLITHLLSARRARAEAEHLLRQHSTFLEPMPRLARRPRPEEKASFIARHRSSSTGR